MLSPDRVIAMGLTPHAHEQEAVDFLRSALPDSGQLRLWALIDLAEPHGRRYELDALVLGTHALYLIEIKSHPGIVDGDAIDWRHTFPDGGQIIRENPLRLCATKARVLGSLLETRMKDRPWVEPLIFLSHPTVQLKLPESARQSVVTRGNLVRAVTHAEFPGASPKLKNREINKPLAQELTRALHSLGISQSKGQARLGELAIGHLIEEGPGYQDRAATHERMAVIRRRVRTYLVPQSTTPERREQLRRAAEREARLLAVLGDHPGILKLVDYTADGPFAGPCVTFEHSDDARPLDAFLRAEPRLSFTQRVELIEKVAAALAYCHKKAILHRALHPGAVLVRRSGEGDGLDVKLYDFQLASQQDGSLGTVHLAQLSHDRSLVYRAPELLEDPSRASVASDVFSLGAIAYLILTGQPPGSDVADRAKLLGLDKGQVPDGLSVTAARDDLSALRGERSEQVVRGDGAIEAASAEERRSLDDLIRYATHPSPLERADSVTAWVNLLLEAATTPSAAAPGVIDPLTAAPGHTLTADLEVKAVLGSGSTARVLRVKTPQGIAALKVALSEDLAPRLRAEADVLDRIRSSRIVGLRQRLTVTGRTALLLDDAGETLADYLADKGPLSLDYARRWGIDLLTALSDLEELGVQHRDIKPQNLAVSGPDGKARHLRLFDFSLSAAPGHQIDTGTPAYRDPFLHARGAWDEAADRWAVAVTLHEMLTGIRPRWAAGSAAATAGEISIEAERLDPSLRGQLAAFFRRALARDLAARFPTASDLLTGWSACFAAPAPVAEPTKVAPATLNAAPIDDQTPIDALPLSASARNALDRAGVLTLGELVQLPDNQLSAIRGVGRAPVQEILQLRNDKKLLAEQRGSGASAPAGPFFPDFRGTDAALASNDSDDQEPLLPADAVAALLDAGLGRLSDVAQAPAPRVARLLAAFPGAIDRLRERLRASNHPGAPATIEAWVSRLLPGPEAGRPSEQDRLARAMLGLDEALGGPFVTAKALADRLGRPARDVADVLDKAREGWRSDPRIGALLERVQAALAHLGGVAPLGRIAQMLTLFLPHQPGTAAEAHRHALALVQIAAELHRRGRERDTSSETAAPTAQVRIHNDELWMAESTELLDEALALGELADELCKRDPLPSSDEVREALAARAGEGTSLALLPPERLVGLAADASEKAARSARLELYPRNLSAERALRLCAGAFTGNEIREETVLRVMRTRYPEAQPIHRPDLDAPLQALGLFWNDTDELYRRSLDPREQSTNVSPSTPLPAPVQGARRTMDEILVQEFEEQLRRFRERGLLRVALVPPPDAEKIAHRIAQRLGVTPFSLEQGLLTEIFALASRQGVTEDAILSTDRIGPAGPHWPLLCQLARQASVALLQRILALPSPVVLVHPGLIARYNLHEFLDGLFRAHETRAVAPAVLLINPGHKELTGQVQHSPTLHVPLPLAHTGQLLAVPQSWWNEPRTAVDPG